MLLHFIVCHYEHNFGIHIPVTNDCVLNREDISYRSYRLLQLHATL